MIPLSLLKQVVELLEYWDLSGFDSGFRSLYYNILWSLKVKLQKLDLRDAYAKLINAKNTDDRDEARIEYLWQRSQIGKVDF